MVLPYEMPDISAYSLLLAYSYQRLTGHELLEPGHDLPQRLFLAPFALVSHDAQDDPIFRYANKTALNLWKIPWDTFIATPSRFSAEEMLQEERNRLLAEARLRGYIDSYKGVRIACDGQRFMIQDTVLWNVIDADGFCHGQACVIHKWQFLESSNRLIATHSQ